jgi:hypothetical protein
MQRRTAVPASTSSPVRSEVIEAEPKSKANPTHFSRKPNTMKREQKFEYQFKIGG